MTSDPTGPEPAHLPAVPARGITCPACNGGRFDVERTQRHPGRVVRMRKCLDCGRRFRTAERVESART